MKTPYPSILVTLLGVASITTASAEIKQAGEHSAKAEASVTTENNGSSSSVKKSVTVTSDGKQTIRKTVTSRDGKEEVVTEITDAGEFYAAEDYHRRPRQGDPPEWG